jgi:hypothetical protein
MEAIASLFAIVDAKTPDATASYGLCLVDSRPPFADNSKDEASNIASTAHASMKVIATKLQKITCCYDM